MYDIRPGQSLLAIAALFLFTGAKGYGCRGGEDPDPGTGGSSTTSSGGGSGTAGSGGGSAGAEGSVSSGGGSVSTSSSGGTGGSVSSGEGGGGGVGEGGGCGEGPPVVDTPPPLGCYEFTDLSAIPDTCGDIWYWEAQSDAFCNARYPGGGYLDWIVPREDFCEGGDRRPVAIGCCPYNECCWNGASFGPSYPASCPGPAVEWQLCEGQPAVCCDTAGGPTFQPECECDAGSVLPQESCSVCCRSGIELVLSNAAACDPAQVMPSAWCEPGNADLVRLNRCGSPLACGIPFEISTGGDDGEYYPTNYCILQFLASGAAGYVQAEESGDYYRGEYIYVQGPGAALWQRYFDSDGDHPPTIPAPPVQCVLQPPAYFERCLTAYDPACERPQGWFVSCESTPVTTCP